MQPEKQEPFDLKPRQLKGFDDFAHLGRYLTEEVQNAIDVRGPIDLQLEYWHRIYEQDRTRLWTNRPQPNGADLTSFIGTQYVDALHARIMKTIFTDRPWVVEGWGDSAKKAPYVEEFHHWTFEDERGQSVIDQVLQNALIDSVGILEVTEGADWHPVRKTIWAKMQVGQDPLTGEDRPVFDEKHQPAFEMADGKYVEVPAPPEGQSVPFGVAQVEIDSMELDRVGPVYEIIDYADFYTLPSHARNRQQVWGYAKRFFRRWDYLQAKVKAGMYDADAVEAIGDSNERDQQLDDTRRGVTVGNLDGRTAEKELFECPILMDLDGKGLRWWLVTLHMPSQSILRLKHDNLANQAGCGRFVRFVPYPRKNSLDGMSVIGHKLITIIEEHTATRNAIADRAALAAAAPLKRLQGALWTPEDTPLGAGSVIDVRDMNEVQAMVVPDVTDGMYRWSSEAAQSAERTIGITDVAAGVQPSEKRTATERRLTAGASEIRTDLVVKRCQEPMEDLFQIRHAIWQNVLRSKQDGLDMPQKAVSGLESRGVDITSVSDGKFTADMLEGKFRGKPRGSTESADPEVRIARFQQFAQNMAVASKFNPMVAAALATPQAAKALMEAILVACGIEDRQAFLGSEAQSAIQSAHMQQMMASMGGGAMGAPQPPPMGLPAPDGGMGMMPGMGMPQ